MPDEQPRPRTTDERIDALSIHLEITAGMQQDNEKAIAQLTAKVDTLATAAQQDGENIRALARIAEIHEHRLSHLEGDN